LSADNAREALRRSVEENRHQVEISDETRLLLEDMVEKRMRSAVADGIATAMTHENARLFMRSLLAEAQQLATEKTGQVVGSAVMALVKRGILFVFLGSIVYALGGWSALAALLKFLKAGG